MGLCHVTMKAEFRVICTAKECQQPPKAKEQRRVEWTLPQNHRKEPTLLTPGFQISSLQNCERIYFYCLKTLWWLILCINMTGPWGAQIFGPTIFWMFLWGCFWRRWTFAPSTPQGAGPNPTSHKLDLWTTWGHARSVRTHLHAIVPVTDKHGAAALCAPGTVLGTRNTKGNKKPQMVLVDYWRHCTGRQSRGRKGKGTKLPGLAWPVFLKCRRDPWGTWDEMGFG